jgi:hypothetical protein
VVAELQPAEGSVWEGFLFAVYVGFVGDGGGLCVVEQLVSIQYEKYEPFLGMDMTAHPPSLSLSLRHHFAHLPRQRGNTMVVGDGDNERFRSSHNHIGL